MLDGCSVDVSVLYGDCDNGLLDVRSAIEDNRFLRPDLILVLL